MLNRLSIVFSRTRAGDDNLSNIRALEELRQCFSIFYDANISTKSKLDYEFSRVFFGEISHNLADW